MYDDLTHHLAYMLIDTLTTALTYHVPPARLCSDIPLPPILTCLSLF